MNKRVKTILIRLKIIAPQKAAEKLRIWNPGTRKAVRDNIRALMTKVKIPRDRICRGKVKNEKTGRIKVLTIPQIKAAMIAVKKPPRYKPGITAAVTIKARALTNNRVKNPPIKTPFQYAFFRKLGEN